MPAKQVRGIYLGRELDRETGKGLGELLVYGGERHVMHFGPNGSGKGTRFLMPNLLGDYLRGRSVVVIDPKGELAAVCAGARHWMENGRPGSVRILDPFGKLSKMVGNSPDHQYLIENGLIDSAGFDPLAALDPDTEYFYDDAAGISEALIQVPQNDPHWSQSAQGLITGLVMWEVARSKKPGEIPTLENIRRLLTEPTVYDDEGNQVRGLGIVVRDIIAECDKQEASGQPTIRAAFEISSLLGRFRETTKEIASIQSTADTQTRWLLSPPMRADLRKRGIDFHELRRQPTTVFLILPAERMRTHAVWLRLVIVSALRAMYRERGLRTVLLLDELAALGHLSPLEDAFGLVRGFGVQIVGVLQDLAQLKALYKERYESLLANAGVVQGFAPNDLTTADWMSRRSGQYGVEVATQNEGTSQDQNKQSRSQGSATSLQARQLFLPHDLFGMPEGSGVLWLAGIANTVSFGADKYIDLPAYNERAMKNPYYMGDD